MTLQIIRQVLGANSIYYGALEADEQARFEARLADLLQGIEFHSQGIDEVTLEMKIVIASAQVQLTFGLQKFLPDAFDNIVVLPSAYRVPHHDKRLIGHVDPRRRMIYLSWEDVKFGFTVHDDAINVALHEFAHCLELESRIDEFEQTYLCKFEFSGWRTVAKDKLVRIRSGRNEFLKDYGGRNLRELFAVCVEAFFEQSSEFQLNLPHLYQPMCDLLNQDPTRRSFPVLNAR